MAVGETSAAAAREAGFERALAAGGNVDHLIETVKQKLQRSAGPLLYASGRQTTGGIADELGKAGFNVVRSVLYEAVAAEALPQAVIDAIAKGEADGVLLYSPRSARIWCRLALAAGIGARHGAPAAFLPFGKCEKGIGRIRLRQGPDYGRGAPRGGGAARTPCKGQSVTGAAAWHALDRNDDVRMGKHEQKAQDEIGRQRGEAADH